jgi:hypothetical protein
MLLAGKSVLPAPKVPRAERIAARKAALASDDSEDLEAEASPEPTDASSLTSSVVMVPSGGMAAGAAGSFGALASAFGSMTSAVAAPTSAISVAPTEEPAPTPKPKLKKKKTVTTLAVSEAMKTSFAKYRQGPSKCDIVSLMWEKKQSSRKCNVHRDQYNRYLIDDFIGTVSVRDGGKWYFEVTFAGQAQYACVGWCTRKYRKRSNAGISSDSTGDAWCVYGPNTLYYHRNRSHRPFANAGADDGDGFVQPNWASGSLVVGCKLDLDEGVMEFTFDGSSGGIAFSGFDTKEALYPVISLNQQTFCTVNYGSEEFTYFPGGDFSPLEHPGLKASSWLTRYRLANEMTRYLTKREPFSDEIVAAALKTEASLEYSHDLRFEIVKSNTTGGKIDNILNDDGTIWSSSRPSDTSITFRVSGFEDTEFVLRGISIRSGNSSYTSKCMVFVGQTEPDFDSFDWCKHFTRKQFLQFESRRKAGTVRKPHEPIAFFEISGADAHAKFKPPVRGKFVTVKIQAQSGQAHLQMDYVKFDCIHGGHPLSSLIGTDDAVKRRVEMLASYTSLIQSDYAKWSLAMDEQLTELSQVIASRTGVAVMQLDSVMMNVVKDDYSRFKKLEAWPETEQLQARFAMIKHLNKLVTPLLHYIDISLYQSSRSRADLKDEGESMRVDELFRPFPSAYDEAIIQARTVREFSFKEFKEKSLKEEQEKKEAEDGVVKEMVKVGSLLEGHTTLSSQVHVLNRCYFMSTKKSVFDALLAANSSSVSTRGQRQRVTMNRIKAARARENVALAARLDPDGLNSVFGQLFAQLRGTRYSALRGTPNEQLFSVNFTGEGSVDVGGPYRECLTMAVSDLQSEATPLFVLCPNGRNSVGLSRDKWMIAPSKTSSTHLAMYEFVGVLMGIALRTKIALAFDFPSIVWKQLLGEPVEITDLEATDKLCVQAMNEMEKIKPEHFEYTVFEVFTTQLSDSTEVELKENGRDMPVTKDNLNEFVSLTIKRRLNESARQIKAMQKGLNAIVPLRMMSLFSWYDLEVLVCGDPNFDVELLRRHTVYQGLSGSTPVVKFFWKALHSFTQTERGRFLQFVWGRQRMPPTEADWEGIQFTIKALSVSPDSLPIAHTCFFSFDLPPYGSFEQCRDKLRFAINNCQAIDIDFNPNSSSLQAWVDDY